MAVIKLRIYVGNLANVMGLFDYMQVHRSENGESGDYTEITAASAAAATLLSSQAAPYTLNGLTLLLKVDGGAEQTITFVTSDPINVDDTVDFVNANLTGAVASEDSGYLRLTSSTTGTASILEITGGTALTELGFTQGDDDNGEDGRVLLVADQTTYEYDDESGDSTYFYKTRYYDSSDGSVSSFSDPIEGDIGAIVGSSYLILAKVDLAAVNGVPISGRRVSFHPVYTPSGLVVDSVGIVRGAVEEYTDAAGHAETMLVQGSIVDVSIAGTGIVRRITVPSSGTEFSVMDAIAAADDVFQIQVPDIPAAVRRS